MRLSYSCLTTLCVAAALTAPRTALRAQTTDSSAISPVVRGARVRVTAPHMLAPAKQSGVLLALRSDSLVLRPDGVQDSIVIPLALVTRVESSRGQHRSPGRGLLIGALVGGALGAVVGAASAQTSSCGSSCFVSGADVTAIVGVLGVAVGGVVGLAVGFTHHSERFENVPRGSLMSGLRSAPSYFSVAPTRHGATLALGVRF